jgi:hypothetical protein
MLFMVIERFKDRDPAPIYARLKLPESPARARSRARATLTRPKTTVT